MFTTYDGKADNVVVRTTSTTYDYAREKYPFTVRLVVPATAAPGRAKVYAEPFCGPPEEYPPSEVTPFQVERSRVALRASPRRPVGGDLLRVRAATCDGPTGALTVRVVDGGRGTDRTARVDSAGVASVSVRPAPAGGRLEVSLPRVSAECRGSSYAGPLVVVVRAAAGAAAAPDRTASPAPSPTSGAATPSPSPSSPAPSVGPAAVPRSGRAGGGGAATVVPVVVLGLLLAAGGMVALRRRGRRG